MNVFEQADFEVRFGWGEHGVRRLASVSSVVIIVDVLSFTTSVEIACSRGARVFPCPFKDASAKSFADSIGARLAVRRDEANVENPFSLSPASMKLLSPRESLVLPSPNGATLSLLASQVSPTTIAGCLRNAESVAEKALSVGGIISIIAAGERWEEDNSLRPAYEDLVGAGAILSSLRALRLSPEAKAAVAAFDAAVPNLEELLVECESGRELKVKGFAEDVLLAAALNQSTVVPVFKEKAFLNE